MLNHELEAIEPTGMEYICVHCDETFDFSKKLQDHVNEARAYTEQESFSYMLMSICGKQLWLKNIIFFQHIKVFCVY